MPTPDFKPFADVGCASACSFYKAADAPSTCKGHSTHALGCVSTLAACACSMHLAGQEPGCRTVLFCVVPRDPFCAHALPGSAAGAALFSAVLIQSEAPCPLEDWQLRSCTSLRKHMHCQLPFGAAANILLPSHTRPVSPCNPSSGLCRALVARHLTQLHALLLRFFCAGGLRDGCKSTVPIFFCLVTGTPQEW